jgi:hypothetical protein
MFFFGCVRPPRVGAHVRLGYAKMMSSARTAFKRRNLADDGGLRYPPTFTSRSLLRVLIAITRDVVVEVSSIANRFNGRRCTTSCGLLEVYIRSLSCVVATFLRHIAGLLATRCLRERQARLNAAAANLKGLAMLARGSLGMWAAATRCLRERQARLNAAAANLKGLAMLARGSLGMWAAAGMLPTGRFATDKVVASATFHKDVCPCPMRSKVLACGFLRDRKRLVRKFLLLKYLGMTGSCEFAGSCCETGAGRRFLAPPSHT